MSYNIDTRHSKTARRLREILNGHGISVAKLSRLTGINKASICRYLSGEYTPSEKNARKLAAALNVDPEWLRGDDDISNLNRLADNYNSLNEVGKDRILEYSEALRASGKYRITGIEEH